VIAGIMGRNTKSIVKKVKKSKSELTGPKEIMNFLMKEMSHRFWSFNVFFVNFVGGDVGLRDVIEQVV
jgi:hypothetical protein